MHLSSRGGKYTGLWPERVSSYHHCLSCQSVRTVQALNTKTKTWDRTISSSKSVVSDGHRCYCIVHHPLDSLVGIGQGIPLGSCNCTCLQKRKIMFPTIQTKSKQGTENPHNMFIS